MHTTVIGAGNLGVALARGWLQSGVDLDLSLLVRSDGYLERPMPAELKVRVNTDPKLLARSDLVVVAVKPGDVQAALKVIQAHTRPGTPVVSVAAGITLKTLGEALPGRPLCRAMPNICAAIGEATTALSFLEAPAEAQKTITELFESIGFILPIDEAHLDAVTALSGSGPAYIYLVLDALIAAGRELGLTEDVSRTLATRTLQGTAGMAISHPDLSPAQLIRQVASPGGTTEAALRTMEDRSVKAAIIEGITQARRRAAALSSE